MRIRARTVRIRARTRAAALVMAAVAVVSAGCGFDPSQMTLPGAGVDGPTYRLDVEFESLLSLPAGADITSGGTKVGTLADIELRPRSVVAEIDVKKSVRLPVGTKAELRQTTVLGDIYMALVPPEIGPSTQMLGDGDLIPLADTDPGAQVEEIMERIATFVNGGSITRFQDSIEQLNSVLPDNDAEARELATSVATNLDDAAGGLSDIDRTVTATRELSDRLYQMRDDIGFIFSETARQRLDRVPYFMTAVLNVVIDVNTLTTGLDWLIPRLPHINTALEKTASLLRTPSEHPSQVYGNAGRMRELAKDKVMPFLADPSIDIRRLSINDNNGDQAKDALVLLRMIGAMK